MLAMLPMTTDNLDACGEFDTTAVDSVAAMLIDSPGVEMSASSRTELPPARQPDLHVPRRLGNRDARQNRIHPREVRNDKRDIATHHDQAERSSLGVLVRFVQYVAQNHRDG